MLSQDDDEEVGLYFVIPSNCAVKEDCDAIMTDTYQTCEQHGLDPQWLTESKCLAQQPDKRNVFVFQEFKGGAFDHLKQFKCVLVGPQCLLTIFKEGIQLPHMPRPFFTMAMHGLIVAATGCGPEGKEIIRKKVENMAGLYSPQLKVGTTHLIVNSVQSEKYGKAIAASVAVMTEGWLEAVYQASLKGIVSATDPQFDKYKCPPFKGLVISTSRLSTSEKKRVVELIQSNGGTHSGSLNCSINMLVITKAEGDKCKYARSWNIPCVTPSWIYESVKQGHAVPIENFELKADRRASTPEKGDKFKCFEYSDMSILSDIGPEERTRVDESMANSTCNDTSVVPSFKMPQKPRQSAPVEKAVFVKPSVPPVPSSPKRSAPSDSNDARSLTPKKNTSPTQFKHLLDELDLQKTKQAGPFLDGCKVFLYGFNSEHEEKLRRVLKGSGASRFTELTDSVTHVLLGSSCDPAFAKQIKGLSYRPHIVTLPWLLQSVSLRRPASEEQFSCAEMESKNAAPETPSPLSKKTISLKLTEIVKGLALLQRGDESPVASKEAGSRTTESTARLSTKKSALFLKELREPDQNDLTTFYRNESRAAPPPQLPPEQFITAHSRASTSAAQEDTFSQSTVSSQTINPVFAGLKFALVGLATEAREEIVRIVSLYGGEVVPQNFKGVPDYAIVPITGATVSTAGEVVTGLWLEDCTFHGSVIPVEYFHQPVTVLTNKYPLRGCVVGLSGYTRKERTFLMEVTSILGGLAQEVFARKDNESKSAKASTHLICNAPEGSKFVAAKKWKLPAVNHLWIMECCKTGTRVPAQPYLVDPSQEYVEPPPVDDDPDVGRSKTEESESLDYDPEADGSAASTSSEAGTSRETRNKKRSDKAEGNVGGGMKTPIRPLAILRIAGQVSQESPHHVSTPEAPFGISENASPGERKRLKKWIDKLPDYPRSPEPPKRRMSTPFSELRRQVWAKFGGPTPEGYNPNKSGTKRGNDDEEVLPQSAKRARIEEEVDTPKEARTPGMEKPPVPRALFPENVARAEGQLEEVNKLLEMPLPTSGKGLAGTGSPAITSPIKTNMAPKVNPKEASQPYNIHWEDPVSVAEARKEPFEPRASTSKRKSSGEDGDLPSKRSSSNSLNSSKEKDSSTESVKEQRPPGKRVFMLSNVDNREGMAEMLRALGGEVIQSQIFKNVMTHLVVDKPLRSEKLLASIASGKWVLHTSYIQDSHKKGEFLEEEPYEWGGPNNDKINSLLPKGSVEENLARAAYRWRTKLSGTGVGAFNGYRAVVGASSSKVQSFSRLIQAGGGVLVGEEDVDTATHYFVDGSKSLSFIKDFAEIQNKVPVLPLLYLNDYLVKDPPPKAEDSVVCLPK